VNCRTLLVTHDLASWYINVGTLPSDLFELETLEQIDLSWNFFVGTLSTSVGKLTNLSLLEGNGNDFHGALPTEIGLLSNLENLGKSISRLCRLICQTQNFSSRITFKIPSICGKLVFRCTPDRVVVFAATKRSIFLEVEQVGAKAFGWVTCF
jgi:hypothetical protein